MVNVCDRILSSANFCPHCVYVLPLLLAFMRYLFPINHPMCRLHLLHRLLLRGAMALLPLLMFRLHLLPPSSSNPVPLSASSPSGASLPVSAGVPEGPPPVPPSLPGVTVTGNESLNALPA